MDFVSIINFLMSILASSFNALLGLLRLAMVDVDDFDGTIGVAGGNRVADGTDGNGVIGGASITGGAGVGGVTGGVTGGANGFSGSFFSFFNLPSCVRFNGVCTFFSL